MKIKKSLLALAIGAATLTSPLYAAEFKAGDTDFNIGGYVKFDASYNNFAYTGNGTIVTTTALKNGDSADDGNLDMSARESRFWLKTSTLINGSTLKTHIEGDFYGSGGNEVVSNSHGLRLRHAYGEMDGILMGQTWSTFMDLAHLGELIDFGQHKSTIFVRQAQARYTIPLENSKVMLAAENPQTGSTDTGTLPDLIARYDYNSDGFHGSAAMMLRQLKSTTGETKTGSAISLTSKVKIGKADDIRMQLNGGALGRYMGLIHPATEGSGSTFDIVNSFGASVAYRHLWNKDVRSTLMYSATQADPNIVTATTLDGTQSLHANVLWDLNKRVRFGAEVQRTNLKYADGSSDNGLNRIQFSARYLF
ncbi:DcaP family trimeric outer membrane transporter [uncultured Amphritea sp.]|uniref:DcaP family trimeric outer membrane transporter n=1 Tax=uncultured Amphritea sp. TaxID=981605 RepID=UPI00262B864C|nr:DcaP family trimeric outer membrane transporter [uncultured Amphritea sp.]